MWNGASLAHYSSKSTHFVLSANDRYDGSDMTCPGILCEAVGLCCCTESFIEHLFAEMCCNLTLFIFKGERGPVGPAVVGPRGIPGIPGERGESVSVTPLKQPFTISLQADSNSPHRFYTIY